VFPQTKCIQVKSILFAKKGQLLKEFGVFKKLLLLSVAMAIMTFQYGGYFWFKGAPYSLVENARSPIQQLVVNVKC
jgi:uncharacterized protein (UPF0333 family)